MSRAAMERLWIIGCIGVCASLSWSCQAIVQFKDPPHECGDGELDAWEPCDGTVNRGETCDSLGAGAGTLGCTSDCQFDLSGCAGVCGNGTKEGSEECDGNDLGGQDCHSQGFDGGTLTCEGNCTFNTGECTGNLPNCGDGYCDPFGGETHDNCNSDCDSVCGNDVCEVGRGESPNGTGTWETCFDDCRWHRISAGGGHTCALLIDGTAWCWGENFDGQLGNTLGPSNRPVQVETSTRFREIAAGMNHTCAVSDQGSVWCWGSNQWGQLGNGNTMSTNTPTSVANVQGADSVAAGSGVSCATTGGGTLYCWGVDKHQELGLEGPAPDVCESSVACSLSPQQVNLPAAVDHVSIALAENDYTHVCARVDGGLAFCWGTNNHFQTGHDTGGSDDSTPFMVDGVQGVVVVAAGDSFSCAQNQDGIHCWGSDDRGQIGNGGGAQGDFADPQLIIDGAWANDVAAGGKHACAWLFQGSMWCWGENGSGQAGHPDGVPFVDTPYQVLLPDNAVIVSAGLRHSCVLVNNGSAWCWGENAQGQLGTGNSMGGPTPVRLEDPLTRWQGR